MTVVKKFDNARFFELYRRPAHAAGAVTLPATN
jgi:hypothetical protein